MTKELFVHTAGIDQTKSGVMFASFQKLLDSSSDLIFIKDLNLTYVAGTQSFAEMVGKPSMAEVIGHTDYEIFEDKELSKRYTSDDKKLLESGSDLIDYVEPLTDEDGEARYSSTSKYILRDQEGNAIGILGIGKDITKEMKASQQYKQVIEYLFTLPSDTYAAILIDVTDWRIVAQRRQDHIRQFMPLFDSMESFLPVAQGGVRDKESTVYELYQQFSQKFFIETYNQGKTEFEAEYQCLVSDGTTRWIRDDWRFLVDPKSGHLNVMLLVRDINSKKIEEEELIHAAITDQMTGLLNRAATREQIRKYLEDDGTNGVHAVFILDLDDFKQVNDVFGHQEGDALLVALATGIKRCFRESDVVGRLGGDEFFVLAKNMPNMSVVEAKVEQLLRMAQDIHATNTAARASVSVGVAMYPKDGTTLDDLYEKADEALYKAKGMGKNRAAFASGEQSLWSSTAYAKRYEAYNSQVVDHSNSICYITDIDTYELLHLTKAGMDVHGMTRPEEYLGRTCYQVIMGREEPCPFCPNSKLREGEEYRWELYNENIGKWFDRTSTVIHLDGRRCHLEIARDVTARKEELDLLSDQLTMEDVLFRCLHTLTKEKDMGKAVNLFLEGIGSYHHANRAYIFEFDLERNILNNTFEWCAEGVSAEKDNLQALPLEVVDGWIRKFKTDGEFSISSLDKNVDPDSEEYRILEMQGIESLIAAPLMQDGEIVGFIGVDDPRRNQGNTVLLRSISEFVLAELERRRLLEKLEYMSYSDALTGLNNRNQYARILKGYDENTPDSMGIVFVDINGLKVINDTHGQSYGDHIIKRVGQAIANTFPGMVFRTGGGEFVALCENIPKNDFQRNAVMLRNTFEQDRDYSVSIGCIWNSEEENIRSLLTQAEELLHADKRSYYNTVLQEGRNTGTPNFSDEVRKEIDAGRFVVYYQPQVDIKTGRIVGAEALVRKKADNGSLIPPNKFIPFYEMEGVIGLVDMFVLDAACATAHNWFDLGYKLNLAVNFSRVTLLEQGIVEEMCRICERHDIPTSAITIEVTESISKMDNEQLKRLIQSINDVGFTISLDDFGSQYSNLAILATMDFDEIKFDRSLVKTLEENRKSQVVMENSVRMCRGLDGTTSLAEGIETKGQLELLLNYQCDYGQGYYFSKPVPAEEFRKLLEEKPKTD